MTINYRSQFISHRDIYLLSHSVGRPPASAQTALNRGFMNPWAEGDADVWPAWLQGIEGFRDTIAHLLNADAGDICPQVNLSSAATKILYSLPKPDSKNLILLSEDDFPSMGFVLHKAASLGYQLKFIPGQEDSSDLNLWDSYLTEDVAFALVTHVHSNTSCLQPAEQIVRLARQRGIKTIFDIAQSVGVVPIDLQQINPDFALGSCVKWLCGGPGAGFLWVNPAIVERCEPVDVGWFSHQDPFEFDINRFRYAQGALRFWGGTPSVLPYVLAANSIQLIDSIGVDVIRTHNNQLVARLMDAAGMDAIKSPVDAEARGGTLVLNFSGRHERVVKNLRDNCVRFDARSTGIRISPHIYNTADEISLVVDCLT